MSLIRFPRGLQFRAPKETVMDFIAAMPEWFVWFAAGAIGAFALATLARILLAALDLEAG